MLKRWTAVLLSCALFQITTIPGQAFSQSETDPERTQKVKRGVLEVGIGPKATIKVTLRDGTKVNGYVSETGMHTFTVTHPKTNAVVPVAYTDVSKVTGRNLSTGAKIAIGVAVGVGAFFLIAYGLFLNWSS